MSRARTALSSRPMAAAARVTACTVRAAACRTRSRLISTGGPPAGPAPAAAEPARKAPPQAAVPGRLTIWPAHTIPAHGSVGPAIALGITGPSRQVIVRRRLASAPDNTPVQFRVSYVPAELAAGTPIAQRSAIPDAWPAALTAYLGTQVRL